MTETNISPKKVSKSFQFRNRGRGRYLVSSNIKAFGAFAAPLPNSVSILIPLAFVGLFAGCLQYWLKAFLPQSVFGDCAQKDDGTPPPPGFHPPIQPTIRSGKHTNMLQRQRQRQRQNTMEHHHHHPSSQPLAVEKHRYGTWCNVQHQDISDVTPKFQCKENRKKTSYKIMVMGSFISIENVHDISFLYALYCISGTVMVKRVIKLNSISDRGNTDIIRSSKPTMKCPTKLF